MQRPTQIKTLLASMLAASCLTFGSCKKSATSVDLMTYIPKDSSMLINLNFEQARGSELFKKYEAEMMSNLPEDFAKIKTECNIDIVTVANRGLIGVGADPSKEDDVIAVVSGTMEQAAVEECITKLGGEGEDKITATTEGKITTYSGGDKPMVTYWPNKSTVVVGTNAARVKAVADGSAGSISTSESMQAQIKNLDVAATVSMVGSFPKESGGAAFSQMGGSPPQTMHMTIKAAKDVALDIGLDFEKEEEATKLAGMITMVKGMAGSQGEEAKSLAEGLTSTQEGATLKLSLSATAEQIEAISAKAQAMGM